MDESENQKETTDYAAFYNEPSHWQKARLFVSNLIERFGLPNRVFYMIGAGIVLVVVALIVMNVWVEPAITNNDQAIGGAELKKPVVEQITILPRTNNTAAVVVHLRNVTKGYGLHNLPYLFTAYNEGGEVLSNTDGLTYLMPEQDRFLVFPVTAGMPSRAEFVVNEGALDYVRPELNANINLELINIEGRSGDSGFEVTGMASNRTAYEFYAYEVTVLLRDFSGKIEGAMSTKLENIRPGEFKNFSLIWPRQLPNNAVVDARITANKLSPVNFDLYSGDSGNFQTR